MAEQQQSKPVRRFEWTGNNYATSHTPPRDAVLLEGLSYSGKRRVMAFGDFQLECRRTNSLYDHATVWHYNEDGTIDGDATGDWTLRALASAQAAK